ncbi:MAG: FimB/Mfa2 family fimbrial subunit [Prevotellaceae bacterium]|nr:FimB/Mfa2 family fimbrial subunit [Prevotellaceae bacterium]
MEILSYARKAALGLLAAAGLSMALSACDGLIYDNEGDCSTHYKVRFLYDYNMKHADAFAHEVTSVTLYLIDKKGNVVWQKTEEGAALAAEGYEMDVDIAPGQYSLLAWCGTRERESFSVPQSTMVTGLTKVLKRSRKADGKAYVDTDIDRLFHGYLPDQEFPGGEGTYRYTLPLVKDTNRFRIVLQHVSGRTVDTDRFTFAITAGNGHMNWDNSLLEDETVAYYPWHTGQQEGEIHIRGTQREASFVTFSAAVAELTTARLVKGHEPRLTVTNNETGTTVLSIPLIDYALLVKGFYNSDMGDQEYLDRQDEYNMVFFLNDNECWENAYIYINSWKVVLQDENL